MADDTMFDVYDPPPEETPEQKAAHRDDCLRSIAEGGETLDLRGKQIGVCGHVREIADALASSGAVAINLSDNELMDDDAAALVTALRRCMFVAP